MTEWLPNAIRAAGVLQLAVVAANVQVVRVLDFRGNLDRCTPSFRHVVWGLHSWTMLTVLAFAVGDLAAPEALAGKSTLGRWMAGTLAALWSWRLGLQLFLYDSEVRRKHRIADVAFTLVFLYVAAVHALAAIAAPLCNGVAS